MTGVAVKVTDPPAQIDVAVEMTDTDGITLVAVIVTPLLVAVAGDAHGSLLVITTVTMSPSLSVVVVNVLLLVPAFTPLTCH